MTVHTILMAAAGGSSVANYFISKYTGIAGTTYCWSTTIDTLGNIYTVGSTELPGLSINAVFITKHDKTGLLVWKRYYYGTSTYNSVGFSIKTDSSGNVYFAGVSKLNTTTNNDAFLAKIDSNGTLLWSRKVQTSTTATLNDKFTDIAFDSTGNVYVCGALQAGYGLVKYSSTGTLLASKYLAGVGGDTSIYSKGSCLAIDSSNNIYVVGASVLKLNSSFAILWQKTYTTGLGSIVTAGAAVDSSGNLYINSSAGASSNYRQYAWKIDGSTGNVLWSYQATVPYANMAGGVVVDGSYAYFAGESILKISLSGTIAWRRKWSDTSLGASYYGTTLDLTLTSNNELALCGYFAGAGYIQYGYLSKVPIDGTLTGTYGEGLVYGTGSTFTSDTVTATTSTRTIVDSSFTDTSGYGLTEVLLQTFYNLA